MNQLERDFRTAFGIERGSLIPPLEAFGIDGKGTMASFIAEMDLEMLEGLGQVHPHDMIRNLAARAAKAERALSEERSKAEAAQEQIERLRGALASAHMARKDARDQRREAMELLQRTGVYSHGSYWPQDLFDAVTALLTRYETGLPLVEGAPK